MSPRRILRLPAVITKTAKSKSTIRRDELAGVFPARVQTGANSVGWFEDEIEAYLAALPRRFPTGAELGAGADAEEPDQGTPPRDRQGRFGERRGHGPRPPRAELGRNDSARRRPVADRCGQRLLRWMG